VWVATGYDVTAQVNNSVVELAPNGSVAMYIVHASEFKEYLDGPQSIAVDGTGSVWASNGLAYSAPSSWAWQLQWSRRSQRTSRFHITLQRASRRLPDRSNGGTPAEAHARMKPTASSIIRLYSDSPLLRFAYRSFGTAKS
jgi:hypothetical protein